MTTAQQQHLHLLRLAVERRLLGQDQAKEVLSLQQRYQQQGYDFSLLHIVLKKGYLDEAQLRALQSQAQAKPHPTNSASGNIDTQRRTLDQMDHSASPKTMDLSSESPTLDWSPETAEPHRTQDQPLRIDLPGVLQQDFPLPGQPGLRDTQPQPPISRLDTDNLETTKRQAISNKIDETLRRYDQNGKDYPDNFGRYRILKELGKGNVGRVFLVNDPDLDRLVALKVLLSARMSDRVSVERFLREAKATAKLDHPHIVRIYDIGKEGDTFYFTMDYLKGKSLDQVLKDNKRMSPRKAAQLLLKICLAMDYAHSQEIIHRDLKPANIMLDESNEPRIMDFGMARVIKDVGAKLSRTGTIMGTPAYMPPEQAHGNIREIDIRSDVYSLGAMLYEMITGRLPFPGKDVMTVLMKVVNEPPTPPRELQPLIPQDLQNICLKSLQKEKNERYPNAKAMADDLERFLDGIAVEAENPAFSFKKWAREHKSLVISVSILLLIIVALMVRLSATAVSLAMANMNLEMTNRNLADKTTKLTSAIISLDNQKKKLEEQTKELAMANKQLAGQKEDLSMANKKLARQKEDLARANIELISRQNLSKLARKLEEGVLPANFRTLEMLEIQFLSIQRVLNNDSNLYLVWAKAYLLFCRQYGKTATIRKNCLEHAMRLLLDSMKNDPKNYAAAVFGLQNSYLFPNPSKFYGKCVSLLPAEGDSFYVYFRQAMEQKLKGEEHKKKLYLQKSLKYLNKTIESNKDFAYAYSERAQIYIYLANDNPQNVALAKKDLQRALELRSDLTYVYTRLAHIYLKQEKDFVTSLQYYEMAISKNKYDPENYIGMARLYHDWGDDIRDYAQKERYYRKVIENIDTAFLYGYPNEYRYRYYKDQLELYIRLKEYRQALKVANIVLSNISEPAHLALTHQYRGECYAQLQNYAQALEEYKKALKYNKIKSKGFFYSLKIKELEQKLK